MDIHLCFGWTEFTVTICLHSAWLLFFFYLPRLNCACSFMLNDFHDHWVVDPLKYITSLCPLFHNFFAGCSWWATHLHREHSTGCLQLLQQSCSHQVRWEVVKCVPHVSMPTHILFILSYMCIHILYTVKPLKRNVKEEVRLHLFCGLEKLAERKLVKPL